ncbi:MAG TPA: hypothetical protein VMC41_02215 [Candidatus Nanoarchaeia archaeon]|nr:hypothetical protein [Candidatus Nanoarchaeia archaeon]
MKKKNSLKTLFACESNLAECLKRYFAGMVDLVSIDLEADLVITDQDQIAWQARHERNRLYIYVPPVREKRRFNFSANVFVIPQAKVEEIVGNAFFLNFLCLQKEYRSHFSL